MLMETQWHLSQVRGIGEALLFFAWQRSVELGYSGRVRLHFLPGTEAFCHR